MELRFVESWIGGGVYGLGRSKRHLNKYRFVESSLEGKYIEFAMAEGIAKCDVEDEMLLKMYSWKFHTGAVSASCRKDGISTRIRFKHEVIGVSCKMVTNINGDRLDCRRKNLEVIAQEVRSDLNHVLPKQDINVLEIAKAGEWMGGIPMGCVSVAGQAYVVRFSSPKVHKRFCISNYDSKEETLKAAETFRYKKAEKRGEIYNKIRTVATSSGDVFLEVSLNGGKSFFCDVEDKNIVEKCVWSAKKDVSGYYVQHTSRKGLQLPSEIFHRLVTDYKVVDHINGNGLDNRKCNLREGTNGVNARNAIKRKDNNSGVTGVAFTKGAWVVQWPENGKRMSKQFGISYGSLEKAKKAAIAFRLSKNKELNLHPRQ